MNLVRPKFRNWWFLLQFLFLKQGIIFFVLLTVFNCVWTLLPNVVFKGIHHICVLLGLNDCNASLADLILIFLHLWMDYSQVFNSLIWILDLFTFICKYFKQEKGAKPKESQMNDALKRWSRGTRWLLLVELFKARSRISFSLPLLCFLIFSPLLCIRHGLFKVLPWIVQNFIKVHLELIRSLRCIGTLILRFRIWIKGGWTFWLLVRPWLVIWPSLFLVTENIVCPAYFFKLFGFVLLWRL
jgi:hypothetical protein